MCAIETIEPLRLTTRRYIRETTIALAQHQGKTVALITDGAPLKMNGSRGIDESKILISIPDNTRQAAEIVETLARSGACDCLVIDGFNQILSMPSFMAKIESICERSGCDIVHLPHA